MLGKKLASLRNRKPKEIKWFRVYWTDKHNSIHKAKSMLSLIEELNSSPYCRYLSLATEEERNDKSINLFFRIEEAKTECKVHFFGVEMGLTVGDLKKSLEGIDDSLEVSIQRIEDIYFEKHGWSVCPLLWEPEQYSEYISASSSYRNNDKFVINAHY